MGNLVLSCGQGSSRWGTLFLTLKLSVRKVPHSAEDLVLSAEDLVFTLKTRREDLVPQREEPFLSVGNLVLSSVGNLVLSSVGKGLLTLRTLFLTLREPCPQEPCPRADDKVLS